MIGRRKYIQAFLCIASVIITMLPAFTACSDNDLATDDTMGENGEKGILKVDVGIYSTHTTPGTRFDRNTANLYGNRFDAKYFKSGAEIGVSATDINPPYAPISALQNIRYTAKYDRDWNFNYQEWHPDSPTSQIMLYPHTNYYIFGHYPWGAGPRPDSIRIKTKDNIDYMFAPLIGCYDYSTWAPSMNPVTYDDFVVKMTMEHAQTILRYKIYPDGYYNSSNVFRCDITGDAFGIEAALDARDGRLWDHQYGTVTQEYIYGQKNFKTDTVSDFFFVIPNEDVRNKSIKFVFDVDGYNQAATLHVADSITGGRLLHGYVYDFTFKIKSMAIELQDVKIIPWDSAGIAVEQMSPYLPHVDLHDYVDMGMKDEDGNPILWAKCNLGAKDSLDVGDYYMWGDTIPYSATHPVGPSYYKDTLTYTNIGGTLYDPVRRQWGGECRMPTRAEWDTLCDKSKYIWDFVALEGVVGHYVYKRVTKNGPRDMTKAIFLPFTGYRTFDLTGTNTGTAADTLQVRKDTAVIDGSGFYWASDEIVTTYPYEQNYMNTGGRWNNNSGTGNQPFRERVAFAIRPVKPYRNWKPYPFK